MFGILLSILVSTMSPDTTDVRVAAATVAPVVDGVLDERDWSRATVVSDFLQRTPVDGGTPSERTEVLLLHTPTALFVGVRASDTQPDRIVATAMRRDDDALLENDQFAMAIDSYNDGRNGYWFSTNPLGVRSDFQFIDEGSQWIDWDGDWQARARTTDGGWSAEIAIPFSTLRFRGDSVVVMGMNFFRRIIRTNEQLFAPHIPLEYPNGTATVSRARRFVFEGIGGKSLGYLEGYGLAGVRRSHPSDAGPSTSGSDEVGLDARLNVADNVSTTLSVNTDFAQVEVDNLQLNLSRFDIFFPEKRAFFLEDGGLFAFGNPQEADVFFSRRIGLAVDSTGILRPVPILAGLKTVARTSSTEIGLLGVRTVEDLEPATSYGVLRLKTNVAPRSYVGGILATAHGGELSEATIGADFNYYFGNVTGARGFAATRRGATGAPWRASSALGAELFHAASTLAVEVGVFEFGSRFEPAVGFVARPGTRRFSAAVGIPRYPLDGPVRRVEPRIGFREYRVIQGGLQSRTATLSTTVDLRSEDQLSAGITTAREVVDAPFEVFRDQVVRPGDYTSFEGWGRLGTKSGRRLSTSVRAGYGGFLDGRKAEWEVRLVWKLARRLTLSPSYRTASVRRPDGDFTANTFELRTDFTLNTSFSVITIGQYDNDTWQLGLNVRAVYQFREGTNLYVVVNHRGFRPALPEKPFGRQPDQTVLAKLTYRVNLP